MTSVFTKFLRDRRRSVTGYSLGVAALMTWVAAIFPTLRDSNVFSDFVENLPPQMLAIFGMEPETLLTAAGYLQSQFYSLFGPLLIMVFAVGSAASATAGEERDGTMDMLLSEPVSRRSVLLQQSAGVGVMTLAIVTVVAVALLILSPMFDLGLSVASIVWANLALWLLAALLGSVALAAGAFTGKPAVARGVAGGLAFLAWLVNAFEALFSWLHGPATVSPFTWYLDVDLLVGGLSAGHLWLAVATATFTVMAMVFFERRDIATELAVLPEKAHRRLSRSARREPRAIWLLTTVCRKTLWDRRKSIWGWLGGLSLLLLVTFAAWPTLARDADALGNLITALPREVFAMFGISDPATLTTPAGFISSRSYLSVGPVIIVLFAVGAVSATVVREEQSGQLDMVLSTPLARRSVIVGKAAGIAISTCFVGCGPHDSCADRQCRLEHRTIGGQRRSGQRWAGPRGVVFCRSDTGIVGAPSVEDGGYPTRRNDRRGNVLSSTDWVR